MTKISFNITTRNDNYYNDNLERLSKTINYNLYFLEQIGMLPFVEFNIIDWGSEEQLGNNIEVCEGYQKKVNFYHVSKKKADALSEIYANKFNMNIPANLAVRLSKGEFIVQATDDQIFSRSGWFNLINIISKKENFAFDLNNTLFYIPRKFIELDFYKKNPSIEVLEEFLNYYNSSYLRSKNSTFYFGGGYSLLCSRELLEKLGGIMNENNDSKSGNDVDLNIRTKRLGINQVDTSSFGVVFYKFASHLNSNRTNLIKKTKLTRQPPPLPLKNYPNDENWGMKNENIQASNSSKIIKNINHIGKKNFYLKSDSSINLDNNKMISLLSKFDNFNFNLKEWKLIFQITKIIGSTRTFGLIEFGFDNVNRLLAIGQEFKSLELLSFDINCDKSEYFYLERLGKLQILLSNKRYGKFTALNSNNFDDLSKCIRKMKCETASNLFLINISSINSPEISNKLEKLLNDFENFTSHVIFWNKNENKNLPKMSDSFEKLYFEDSIQIFQNKKILENKTNNKNILFSPSIFKMLNLIILYLLYSVYKYIAESIKKFHKILFKFKY